MGQFAALCEIATRFLEDAPHVGDEFAVSRLTAKLDHMPRISGIVNGKSAIIFH